MLAFPSGAHKVRCGLCSTITSGLRIRCTSCREPMSIKLGRPVVKCPSCKYEFTPQAKLKIVVNEDADKETLPRLIRARVLVDRSVSAKVRDLHCDLVTTQPLRETAMQWAQLLTADLSRCAYYNKGKHLTASMTPRELELKDHCEIEIRQSNSKNVQGHDFATSQFSGPTNCAQCKEFIWGIYHQGKRCTKCKIPVHHRCAEKVLSTCESDLRNMFGIVNINDDDDEGDEAPVLGVVIDEEDKLAFASRLEEVKAPECDPNFMQGFSKLSNFSDEEIQQMWLQYDKDESGFLDEEEIRALLVDLVSAGGAHANDMTDMRDPVERLIARMDTNGDHSIQWEEFWNFFKAQQDANFLTHYDGIGELSLDNIYQIWLNYDQDGSGVLEVDEVLRLLNDLLEQVDATALGAEKARVMRANYKGAFESFLSGAEQVTWEAFFTTFVPLLQQSQVQKAAAAKSLQKV
ncbi:calcium-binding protein, putative [Bodo saltans]|uniref:Calcium-binding protein, putative n=1 Tax=Bodo saltans TaxID=75058 RepID=A0A0S4JJZ0_BODSA|nr:calcium-binding protein, putative [Bodo saltans]|eukprot:CUG91835.1 calcium-binding protein, putative [Bodo saltans]